jgi:hypothetical protein
MASLQISKNVEREILNHKRLLHPNVVQFKEVCRCALRLPCAGSQVPRVSR